MDPFPAITPALGRCSDGIRDWGSITLFSQAVNALGNSIINLRNMLVVCEYATSLPRLARLYIVCVPRYPKFFTWFICLYSTTFLLLNTKIYSKAIFYEGSWFRYLLS